MREWMRIVTEGEEGGPDQMGPSAPIKITLPPKDPEVEERLRAFMQDLWDHTYAHPFMRGHRVTENAVIECRPWQGTILVKAIQSLEPRKGGGTEAMNLLCELADKHQVVLTGTAKKFGDDKNYMTTAKLKAWYPRFGWVIGRGNAHDGYDMRREPKPLP